MLLCSKDCILEIADTNGAILSLKDRRRDIDFIRMLPAAPFRITVAQTPDRMAEVTEIEAFELQQTETGAQLHWTVKGGIHLHGEITMLPDGVQFTSHAECAADVEMRLVEYPILGGLGAIGRTNTLAHAFATGLMVDEPLRNFKPREGIRYAPYPECFSGASMQFFTYYAQGEGGLYFAALDGESHVKWLNFYRNGDGLEATMMYGYEDLGKGKGMRADYPFEVRFLNGDGWQEAATQYKAWAVTQPWCAMGITAQRPHSKWLMEKVGLATFGVNAGYDRARYIRKYHGDVGTSVFHVLGPDWTNTPQTFRSNNPGGYDDWLPTRFNKETLDAIREVGDYFAPFEFDTMALSGKADADEVEKARHQFPKPPYTYSCDKYLFSMLCPHTDYMHQLHVRRDTQIVREAQVNAMYYDISANNLLHICMDETHGHPVGGGGQITADYKRVYADTKASCQQEAGEYFPLGTEMINEVFLPEIDFYQARAGARPCSELEMWPYKELIDTERARLIPMFAFVYHEYGAVRMDGWGKLVEELGTQFFDNVAKIYLWGGLYELNYEYSPAEALDGVETVKEEHYWDFRKAGYEYSPGRARYLRQYAALRTGAGNRFLAYGAMMKEPDITTPMRKKYYHHYNHHLVFDGEINLPAVRCSAYRAVDGTEDQAVFLANTELDVQRVSVTLPAGTYKPGATVTLLSAFDPAQTPVRTHQGTIPQDGALSLVIDVPPRKVVMLEIT